MGKSWNSINYGRTHITLYLRDQTWLCVFCWCQTPQVVVSPRRAITSPGTSPKNIKLVKPAMHSGQAPVDTPFRDSWRNFQSNTYYYRCLEFFFEWSNDSAFAISWMTCLAVWCMVLTHHSFIVWIEHVLIILNRYESKFTILIDMVVAKQSQRYTYEEMHNIDIM